VKQLWLLAFWSIGIGATVAIYVAGAMVNVDSPGPSTVRYPLADVPASAPFVVREYPLAVVKSGTPTVAAARAAMANDPVVRRAYRGGEPTAESVTLVDASYYVQYRIGNQVFWTRKPRKLFAGEPVLRTTSDVLIRRRCGNTLALTLPPHAPLLPLIKETPIDEEMDHADYIPANQPRIATNFVQPFSTPPGLAELAPALDTVGNLGIPGSVSAGPAAFGAGPLIFGGFPGIILPAIASQTGTSGCCIAGLLPAAVIVAAAPEPRSAYLLVAGMLGIMFERIRRSRRG
jgi:hypothetical protein